MVNKEIQKVYEIAKKIEYGTNFTSSVKHNGIFISINTGKNNNKNALMKIEQEVLKEFGNKVDTLITANNLMIKIGGIDYEL